jgi:hypothetical protein
MADLEMKTMAFGNEDNGIENEEDNDRDVLNEYLLEQMRLDDVGGEDGDEVSVDQVQVAVAAGRMKMLPAKLLMLMLLLSWTMKLLDRP